MTSYRLKLGLWTTASLLHAGEGLLRGGVLRRSARWLGRRTYWGLESGRRSTKARAHLSSGPRNPITPNTVRSILEECGLSGSNITIYNTKLYVTAFSHPSQRDARALSDQNQRLEFLGDAVLNLIVASMAFEQLPNGTEGDLTTARRNIVNRGSLAQFARKLGLDRFLEDKSVEISNRILADIFESFVAARYLDVLDGTGGDVGAAYADCQAFIRAVVATHCNGLIFEADDCDTPFFAKNRKGELNELCLRHANVPPRYDCIETIGSQDLRLFVMRVDTPVFGVSAEGVGSTKLEASHRAAEVALELIAKKMASQDNSRSGGQSSDRDGDSR